MHDALTIAGDGILAILEELRDRRAEPSEVLRRVEKEIFPRMAQALDSACTAWVNTVRLIGGQQDPLQDIHGLYLWPGYQAISFTGPAGRVTARKQDPLLSVYLRQEINCGLICSPCRDDAALINASAAAFACLLSDYGDLWVGGERFSPPSTHMWISAAWRRADWSSEPRLATEQHGREQAVPPSSTWRYPTELAVELRPTSAERSASVLASAVRVPFHSAREMRDALWNAGLEPFWPSHLFSAGDGPDDPERLELSLALYDVWLASNTSTAAALKEVERLRRVVVRLSRHPNTDLGALESRLDLFEDWANQNTEESRYKVWYTFRMPQGLRMSPLRHSSFSLGLGSVMLLSREVLDPLLLHILREWTQEAFYSVRRLEEEALHEVRGRLTVSAAFGHEIKHIARCLMSDWWFTPDEKVAASVETLVPHENWPREREWAIIPNTQILETLGQVLAAWTFRPDTGKMLFKHWPETLPGLVGECWVLANRLVAPLRSTTVAGKERPDDLLNFWQMATKVAPVEYEYPATTISIPREEVQLGWRRSWLVPTRDEWSTVALLLLGVFDNAVRHGRPQGSVQVKERHRAPSAGEEGHILELSVSNARRSGGGFRKDPYEFPWTTNGRTVLRDLASTLTHGKHRGTVTFDDSDLEEFRATIEIPIGALEQ